MTGEGIDPVPGGRDGVAGFVVLGAMSAALVALLLALFSAHAPLPQAFAVQGTVMWPEGAIPVMSPEEGVVTAVRANPGAQVAQGDPLAAVLKRSGETLEVRAPTSGTLDWQVAPLTGAAVRAGSELGVVIRPLTQRDLPSRSRVARPPLSPRLRRVEALVGAADIAGVTGGQTVLITRAGEALPERQLIASVARVSGPLRSGGPAPAGTFAVTIHLRGDHTAMPLIGTEVTVRFEADGGRLAGLIAPLFGTLGGSR